MAPQSSPRRGQNAPTKSCLKYPADKKGKHNIRRYSYRKPNHVHFSDTSNTLHYLEPVSGADPGDSRRSGVSGHKRAERRALNMARCQLNRRNNEILARYFRIYPLGVRSDGSSAPDEFYSAAKKEIKEIKAELKYAPEIFWQMHPFDDALVLYFNSIGTFDANGARVWIEPSKTNESRLLQFMEPIRYMPIALERSLWNYRRDQARSWYCSKLKNSGVENANPDKMYEDMEDYRNCGGSRMYIDDAMEYFQASVSADIQLEVFHVSSVTSTPTPTDEQDFEYLPDSCVDSIVDSICSPFSAIDWDVVSLADEDFDFDCSSQYS